jgi:hypothetical protein
LHRNGRIREKPLQKSARLGRARHRDQPGLESGIEQSINRARNSTTPYERWAANPEIEVIRASKRGEIKSQNPYCSEIAKGNSRRCT